MTTTWWSSTFEGLKKLYFAHMYPLHYAPETLKMWRQGLTLIILPSLGFYVKSNFGELKRSKNVIFVHFRGSQFWFYQIWATFNTKIYQKFKVQSLWNCQKWHFWTVWIHQNWISRKIRMAVKCLNFTCWKFLEHSGLGLF